MEKYYLFFVLAFVAEVVGTVSGFGSSILFVPLATIFFDFKTVLGVTAVFHIFSNLSKIALFRNGIDRRIALKLGIPAVIFVIIGALLTRFIPQKEIELLMNLVLVAMAAYLIWNNDKKMAETDQNLIIGGAVSGVLAGLIGTGGAIRGLVLMAFQLEKDIFIATSALIDLGVDFSRAVVYVMNGYFLREHLILIPFLILISISGTWVGKLIIQRTSERLFRYIVLGIIVLTSLVQSVKYFWG